jgi:hypothetical protein
MVQSVQVYDAKLKKKLAKLERDMLSGAKNSVDDLLKIGVIYAKVNAPKLTGKTASLIKSSNKPQRDGSVGQIISPNSTPNKTWSGGKFILPRWLAESPNAPRLVNSGDARYMKSTTRYLNRIKKDIARQRTTTSINVG